MSAPSYFRKLTPMQLRFPIIRSSLVDCFANRNLNTRTEPPGVQFEHSRRIGREPWRSVPPPIARCSRFFNKVAPSESWAPNLMNSQNGDWPGGCVDRCHYLACRHLTWICMLFLHGAILKPCRNLVAFPYSYLLHVYLKLSTTI